MRKYSLILLVSTVVNCKNKLTKYKRMVLTEIWKVCSIMSSTARSDPCATKYSMTANAWLKSNSSYWKKSKLCIYQHRKCHQKFFSMYLKILRNNMVLWKALPCIHSANLFQFHPVLSKGHSWLFDIQYWKYSRSNQLTRRNIRNFLYIWKPKTNKNKVIYPEKR